MIDATDQFIIFNWKRFCDLRNCSWYTLVIVLITVIVIHWRIASSQEFSQLTCQQSNEMFAWFDHIRISIGHNFCTNLAFLYNTKLQEGGSFDVADLNEGSTATLQHEDISSGKKATTVYVLQLEH